MKMTITELLSLAANLVLRTSERDCSDCMVGTSNGFHRLLRLFYDQEEPQAVSFEG